MKRWASFHRHQYREDTEMKFEVDVSDIHIHVNIKPDQEVRARLDAILDQLGLVIENQESHIMPSLDELQAKATATLAKVTSDTDIDNAVATVVNNQNATPISRPSLRPPVPIPPSCKPCRIRWTTSWRPTRQTLRRSLMR